MTTIAEDSRALNSSMFHSVRNGGHMVFPVKFKHCRMETWEFALEKIHGENQRSNILTC